MLENSDKSHYPELYQDGCCGCLFCDCCPATTAFICGSSGPCCGSCGYNQAWKISTLMNIVRARCPSCEVPSAGADTHPP